MKRFLSFLLVLVCLTGTAWTQELPDPQAISDYYAQYHPFFLASIETKFGASGETLAYLLFFDSVWGELVRQEGAVTYETLTEEQQRLICYPQAEAQVAFTPKGKSYHATPWCYTLLRSREILQDSLEAALLDGREPCSKCVKPLWLDQEGKKEQP